MNLTLGMVAGILDQVQKSKALLIHIEYRDFVLVIQNPVLSKVDRDAIPPKTVDHGTKSAATGVTE